PWLAWLRRGVLPLCRGLGYAIFGLHARAWSDSGVFELLLLLSPVVVCSGRMGGGLCCSVALLVVCFFCVISSLVGRRITGDLFGGGDERPGALDQRLRFLVLKRRLVGCRIVPHLCHPHRVRFVFRNVDDVQLAFLHSLHAGGRFQEQMCEFIAPPRVRSEFH